MERSQSYTSFETAGNVRQKQLINNLSKNKFHQSSNNNNNNNNISNYYKNKFASTSSLNLRKALELRQTQLQLQQQHQQEQLQRQQWRLLFEQRHQQQHQQQHHQQQQQQQQQQMQNLQHAASIDQIDAPLYLSTLNNLQLMQVQRQKMLQRQKSTTSNEEMDFQHDDEDDDDDDNECYGVVLREHVYETVVNNEHNNNQSDNELTLTANSRQPAVEAIPQKLLRFQRQRPHSEAAINYHIATLSPMSNLSCAPTVITATAGSTANSERRRLQQSDQALSFDSAINNTIPNKPNRESNTINSMSPLSARHTNFGKLKRDNSLHSDSSRYSSVDSLLEARKPDPEAILINLGFGPVVSEDILSRIPKRFLKPSQVRGIDTEAFIRRLQLANSLADHSVLGYRGLIGNPDLPPSTIVAKIMERFEVNERKKSMGSIEQTMR